MPWNVSTHKEMMGLDFAGRQTEPTKRLPSKCRMKPSIPDWTSLPDVVLSHIFKFLDLSDKLVVGHVSKAWREGAAHPAVWRHVSYDERRTEDGDHAAMLNCLSSYGHCVRHLVVRAESVRGVEVIEQSCRVCCNLTSVSLSVWRGARGVFHLVGDIRTLCDSNPRLTDLRVANVDFPDGFARAYELKYVERLSVLPSQRSKSIFDFKKTCQPSVVCSQLAQLSLSHWMLRPELLIQLADKCPLLTRLRLFLFELPEDSPVSDQQWLSVTQRRPDLRVDLHFVRLSESQIFHIFRHRLLTRAIPVRAVVFDSCSSVSYVLCTTVVPHYSATLTAIVDLDRDGTAVGGGGVGVLPDGDAGALANLTRVCPLLDTFVSNQLALTPETIQLIAFMGQGRLKSLAVRVAVARSQHQVAGWSRAQVAELTSKVSYFINSPWRISTTDDFLALQNVWLETL